MNVDSRGVGRGRCNFPGCSCFGYDGTNSNGGKCDRCGHPPPRHANSSMMAPAHPVIMTLASDDSGESGSLSLSGTSNDGSTFDSVPPVISIRRIVDSTQSLRVDSSPRVQAASPRPSPRPHPRPRRCSSPAGSERPPPLPSRRSRNAWSSVPLPTCQYPNCQNPQFFDLNTRTDSMYCSEHRFAPPPPPSLPTPLPSDQFTQGLDMSMKGYVAPDGMMGFHATPLPIPNPQPFPPQQWADCSSLFTPPQTLLHPSQSAPNFQTNPPQHQAVQANPLAPPPGKLHTYIMHFDITRVGSLVVFPLALLPEGERCIYPQCNKRRYKEGDGKVHNFCGRYHATEYKKLKGGMKGVGVIYLDVM